MQSLVDWKPYLWVSLGGIVGASSRYFLSRIITRFTDAAFPLGTLVINVTGSLVLGFFLVWTTERVFADPEMEASCGHWVLRIVHNVFQLCF